MPSSSDQILYAPPKPDELEVSLLGPGIGECIVAHIGNNEWIIVDSCTDALTKEPVPLVYLEKLGINPSRSVKLFVISHWHSDHIRGASQIAEQCVAATIYFSEALLKEEFLTLVDTYSGLEQPVLVDRNTCATKEIASIIKTIKKRCERNNNTNTLYFAFASADKRIYQNSQNGILKEIWALSPSSESIIKSLTEIANLIKIPNQDLIRKVIPRPTKNHNAVVLVVTYNNDCKILLGSDLEETNNPLTGWSAIVNSPNRPIGKSDVFKIPHHGSETAHSNDVWTNMVEKDGIGVLTSKIGGRSNIPKPGDIKRLKGYITHLFCTSEPLTKKQKRDRTVEKTIKSIVKKRVPLNGEIGHIQLRIDNNSGITVRLKSPAKKL